MTRNHRSWHRVIWIALAVIVGTGFVLALTLRPAPAATPAPISEDHAR
jgi:integral membrane sensor domain MASE1